VLLSYCVVNTNGREDLLACLEAIRRTTPPGLEHEVLVLDNASDDGSADAVREIHGRSAGEAEERPVLRGEIRLIAQERRAGKAENDSRLLREARGDYCLLLNEDSELQPGAVAGARRLRGPSCSHPTGGRCPAPGASRASRRRSRAPRSCTDA
jgi:N-acetylglucosaminyl-diphospho-decaprenol L-rhamnosyltransferase